MIIGASLLLTLGVITLTYTIFRSGDSVLKDSLSESTVSKLLRVDEAEIATLESKLLTGKDVTKFICQHNNDLIQVVTGECPAGTFDLSAIFDPKNVAYVNPDGSFRCIARRATTGTLEGLSFVQEGIECPPFNATSSAVSGAKEAESALLEAQFGAHKKMQEFEELSKEQAKYKLLKDLKQNNLQTESNLRAKIKLWEEQVSDVLTFKDRR